MHRLHVAGQISEETKSQALEGLAGWLLDRFRGFRRARTADRKQMRLLETLSLGGKRQLMLVECGGERYLVGGGLESVQTIVPMLGRPASGIAENR